MDGASNDIPYWSDEPSMLTVSLGSSLTGLSPGQAATQLARLGPNSVEDTTHLGTLRLLLRQFESPLVLILVFAAGISMVLHQWLDAAIILAIVLGSSLLRSAEHKYELQSLISHSYAVFCFKKQT